MAKEKATKTVGTDKSAEGREKALQTAMAQIEKTIWQRRDYAPWRKCRNER